jgi:hypothetical protein
MKTREEVIKRIKMLEEAVRLLKSEGYSSKHYGAYEEEISILTWVLD